MSTLRLDRLLHLVTAIPWVLALFWLGLALFTAGLAVLLYTRWGQYKPLRKCMALSLLAHLLLATYAATIQIVTPQWQPSEDVVQVAIGDAPAEKPDARSGLATVAKTGDPPWEVLPGDAAAEPESAPLERAKTDLPTEPKRLVRAPDPRLPGDPPLGEVALGDAKPLRPKEAPGEATASGLGTSAVAIEAPPARRRDAASAAPPAASESSERLGDDPLSRPARPPSDDAPLALLQPPEALPRMSEGDDGEGGWKSAPPAGADGRQSPRMVMPSERIAGNAGGWSGLPGTPSGGGDTPGGLASSSGPLAPGKAPGGLGRGDRTEPLPDAYRLRVAPNRTAVTERHGGTAETEAAVKAALKWLADNQAADGRWDPRAHGAGRETNVLGRDRQSAGSRADSALTGLSLLAFLAAGHTHLDGPYHEDVRRGLEYLMSAQAADGNLAGQAAAFEFMYSHAIATCALSEAYGMTHDARLREPVRRAIAYSVAAQDPVGGGWRYRPGDAGDTSQLGWQLMALKSAELAGLPIPDATRQGIIRYLRSVSSGKYGGRASYRPGEQATRSMSAEALVCWQFLGLSRQHPACDEAGDYLLGELPSEGQSNVYYWYYATLGMYQLQGAHWRRWNDALRTTLVGRQVKDGPLAGSWDTDDVWGGYGGRVYTTALSALALEVYYRFLPLYGVVAPAEAAAK